MLVLPTAYPVTSQNLNYSGMAVAATILLALVSWVLTAHRWFKGPVRNVDTGNRTEVLAEAYMQGEWAPVLLQPSARRGGRGRSAVRVGGISSQGGQLGPWWSSGDLSGGPAHVGPVGRSPCDLPFVATIPLLPSSLPQASWTSPTPT